MGSFNDGGLRYCRKKIAQTSLKAGDNYLKINAPSGIYNAFIFNQDQSFTEKNNLGISDITNGVFVITYFKERA